MSDAALRSSLIRLAATHPEFRRDLLPLLRQAGCEKLPEGGMRDNCEKKVEEGKSDEGEKKEASSSKTAHGPVSLRHPDVMLYMIDAENNNSKFYEMAVTYKGSETSAKKEKDWTHGSMGPDGGFVLQRRWGALTDSGSAGRVDSMNDIFATESEANRAMSAIQNEKTRKGYQDVSDSREYPIGLTRKPSFGWGEQAACRYVPELKSLSEHVSTASANIRGLRPYVDALAARDSSMGRKLQGLVGPLMEQIEATERYLNEQLRACR